MVSNYFLNILSMEKNIFIFILVFVYHVSSAQIKTGISVNSQLCSVCVNQLVIKTSWATKICEDEVYGANHLSLPRRINTSNIGAGISFYAISEFVNLYDNLIIGGGVNIGYSYNYYKAVNYLNFPIGISSFKIHYITNDVFVNTRLFKWIYLEAGINDHLLLYRDFAKEFKLYKGSEFEKKYPIPYFYNNFYFSLGIEFRGVNLKFRHLNIKKNILVEYLSDIKGKTEKREPIVTKFSDIYELTLSIPIKTFKSKKLPSLIIK